MEKLVSSAPSHELLVPPPAVSLPVIDLSLGRDEVRRAVLDTGKELGFFQVVNHGVPEHAMRDMEAVCEEFFRLPAPVVAPFYSDDRRKPNRLFSGSTFETGGDKYWMDCLRLTCTFPAGDSKNHWPDKPEGFREVVEKFIVLTRGMGMGLLRLLCEGLGLRPNYFEGPLGGSETIIGLNHYPSCSNLDPRLGLGLPPHCDRNLITLLLPGVVPGLQVSYKGDWITVEPVPNAFVVNLGLQLELIHHFSTEQVVRSSIGGSNHHYICWFALAGCDQRGSQEHRAPGDDQPGDATNVGGGFHPA
ncbi:hypothetical protein CFC21_049316 [Triticum aestivum]|uniref:Fe2OG dioxygenase domain-containing protein n=2 Tax=Triticum aestivum TaxID=4565 RepID=A0A9R1G357_WHEAT|nr:hypothetical protein CFC21_049313 [Triticum aestivum]KAF7039286.1 hypothetical protein CFC21_049316 [Triticum aestivum]